jgi:hypothetical protein
MRTRRIALVLALFLILGFTGCGKKASKESVPAPTQQEVSASMSPTTATDYSDPARWYSVPANPDKPVDVFYLCPTGYTRETTDSPIVGPVDDPAAMQAAQSALKRQAAAFELSANIFAPYYRQADSASRAGLPQAEQVKIVAGAPTEDGIAAFEYFLKKYNDGRPFILVSHSQGSNVMANLLASYMKANPDVYKRMIAAYVVGYSITPEYLAANPHLKFATGPDDTGVIVSWNTEARSIASTNPVTLPGGIAINPISWSRGEETATAAQNLGSILLDPFAGGAPLMEKNGQPRSIKNLADARVDKKRGVVVCSTPNPKHYEFGLPEGVYHPFDYPFYFFDVRANAADRINSFNAQK